MKETSTSTLNADRYQPGVLEDDAVFVQHDAIDGSKRAGNSGDVSRRYSETRCPPTGSTGPQTPAVNTTAHRKHRQTYTVVSFHRATILQALAQSC